MVVKRRRNAKCELATHHASELLKSGITYADAQDAGIYSESDPDCIKGLLNWKRRPDGLGNCLVIPYRNAKGRLNGYCRIKPDQPRKSGGKYEAPKGKGNRPYFPSATISSLDDTSVPLFITEGEKKALSMSIAGYASIGIAGVDCWGKGGELIPDLRQLNWNDRKVYIAFDFDEKCTTQKHVNNAIRRLSDALKCEGAEVLIVRLPPGPDRGKQGIDDFLVAHGKEVFDKLLTDARLADGAVTIRMNDVEQEKTEWLWNRRIPFGAITIIDGDPGLGKSTITTDLAARLSTGRPMPGGKVMGKKKTRNNKGNVLLLSAEDDPKRTIRPRLEAADADSSRITLLPHINDVEVGERPVLLPRDIPAIERIIVEDDVRLVIIDPLMAYLEEKINPNSDASVRRCLHPLKMVAERTRVAIVILRHLNKQAGSAPIYRGGGSIGITGSSRSALVIGKHPEEKSKCVLHSAKSNLGPLPLAITYRVGGVKNDFGGTSKIEWGNVEDIPIELILDQHVSKRPMKVEECKAEIQRLLKKGPMLSKTLQQRTLSATDVGVRTFKDARQEVCESEKEPVARGRWWSRLRGQKFPWEQGVKVRKVKRPR